MNKKTLGIILAGAALFTAAVAGYRTFGWGLMGANVNSLHLDLSKPDALIVTHSLSTLPRDLLTISLARDVLREEFLFYYEQREDRLGLKGSLRRIAYEHELGWGDQLIRMVLDQPAEVAIWRDGDGSLKHFAIAVSRSQMTRLLEEAGKVALKDTQMTVAGALRVEGDSVPVYALNYAYGRTLLFAAHGQRLVILSHPGMLYGGKEGKGSDSIAEGVITNLLTSEPARQHIFHEQFRFDKAPDHGHSVAVKADFLSFGYQPFFGALEALRFDFSKGSWKSQVLVDAARLKKGGYDSGALWSVLPYNPSGCFTMPADWAAMQPVLKRVGGKASTPVLPLADQLSGPVAACWYGASRLHTPVFVASRASASKSTSAPAPASGGPAAQSGADALFGALFDAAIGGGGQVEKTGAQGGAVRWQRTVTTALGETSPTLAVVGNTVVFSADARLVDQVLAVQRKQAPAAGDRFADAGHTVGLIAPASLAQLIQKEAFDTLPANQEPVLRAAADEHLVPRLNALKKYPPYRMVLKSLPQSGMAWQALEWQALER